MRRALFVAAYTNPPSTMRSTTGYGPVPLWWRELPADYKLPLFQGKVSVPAKGNGGLGFAIGAPHKSFDEFKKEALKFIQADAEQRQMRVLRSLARKYFADTQGEGREFYARLDQDVQEAKNPEAVTNVLFTALAKIKPNEIYPLMRMLRRVGVLTTEATSDQASKRSKEVKISDAEKSKLRKALREGGDVSEIWRAFEVLSSEEPASIVNFLVKWKNPNKEWSDRDQGYVFGSYFAWRCGDERQGHLLKLIEARDPFIRVSGAVYLCFENEKLGRGKLKELMKLEGDPGVWAALTLARRGEKMAIERALEVFNSHGEDNMAGVPHRNLQKRMMVLLSNTAKASNLPQPGFSTEPDYYKRWWQTHQADARLYDPWLPLLEKQKVD